MGPVSLSARWREFGHFCYAIAGRSWGEENKTKATMLWAYLSLKLETDFLKVEGWILKTSLQRKKDTLADLGLEFGWLDTHPLTESRALFFFSSPAIFSSFFLSFSSFPEKKKIQVRFRTVIKISQAQPLSTSSTYFFFFLLQRFHGKERPVSNLRVFWAEGTPNKLKTKLTRGQRHSFHFHTLRKKKHAPHPHPNP